MLLLLPPLCARERERERERRARSSSLSSSAAAKKKALSTHARPAKQTQQTPHRHQTNAPPQKTNKQGIYVKPGDDRDRLGAILRREGYLPVWLEPPLLDAYYNGFCNR